MGRKSLAKVRRAEIAHGLFQSIAKRGYAKTSIREIARETNIGLGQITHYFKNKDEILYAMTEEIFNRYSEMFFIFYRKHRKKPPRECLRLTIDYIFLKIASDKDLIKVFEELWSLAQHDEYLFGALRQLYKQYRELVKKLLLEMWPGQKKMDAEIKDLAAFIVAASEGTALLWFMEPEAISLERMSIIANQLVDASMESEAE
jgi:AcrR family transcriptional regulator